MLAGTSRLAPPQINQASITLPPHSRFRIQKSERCAGFHPYCRRRTLVLESSAPASRSLLIHPSINNRRQRVPPPGTGRRGGRSNRRRTTNPKTLLPWPCCYIADNRNRSVPRWTTAPDPNRRRRRRPARLPALLCTDPPSYCSQQQHS